MSPSRLIVLLSISFSAQAQDFGQRMEAGKPVNLAANEQRYNQSVSMAIRGAFNFSKCWPSAQDGERIDLKIVGDAIVSVGLPATGHLENIVAEPDSPVARCYLEKIERITLPPPPRSPLPFASIFAIIKN